MTEMLARHRSAILLGLGIILSLATAAGVYTLASGPQQPNSAPPTEVDAVVAAVDIKARTVVTKEMVKSAKLPVTAVPASAARLLSEVIGHTTLADIPVGAMVLKPQLLSASGQTGQSISIEPGKVLVAFPTSDPLTAAGLVSAGDRVDLLATIVTGAETGRTTQTTIQGLEVVQVLGPSEATPNQPRALTFIVDHQVALFLKFLRDHQASVEIAVRSRAEREAVKTQHVNVQVLEETFGFR